MEGKRKEEKELNQKVEIHFETGRKEIKLKWKDGNTLQETVGKDGWTNILFETQKKQFRKKEINLE